MRKTLLFFSIIIIMIFLLPIILTIRFNSKEVSKIIQESNKEISNSESNVDYNYSKYGTIKLLHSKTEEVEELNIDEYLVGVISAEMPVDYEIEALKAQAVVARSYTIYKMENSKKHNNADICDESSCCQAWLSKEERFEKWSDNKEENWEKLRNAVNSTKGKIITYQGNIINAFFHANSGGKTEEVSNVWGGTDYPYLQSIETSGEEGYNQYLSEVTFTKDEFINKVKENYKDFNINYEEADCIKILEYTEGNRVKEIKIGNLNLSGVEVRKLLNLKSANFDVEITENIIQFKVKGYGHGVGMSQTGANTLSKNGLNYEEIIKHFYTGVEISEI